MPALEGIQAQVLNQHSEYNSLASEISKVSTFRNRNEISFPTTLGIHIAQAARTLFEKIAYFFSKQPTDTIFEKRGKKLTGSALLNYLESILPKNTHLVQELFVADMPESNYMKIINNHIQTAKEKNLQFISIPICSSGHIVHLLIELKENDTATLEFFDSFGFGPEKYTKGSQTIQEIMNNLSFKKTTTYVHRAIIQKDKHSCGVYVADHFNKRLGVGIKKEKILELYKDTNLIEHFRVAMGRTVKDLSWPKISHQQIDHTDDF